MRIDNAFNERANTNKFRQCDRLIPHLPPTQVDKWLPSDHGERFVAEIAFRASVLPGALGRIYPDGHADLIC